MLKQRVITSLWGLLLLIVTNWFGSPWFTLLIAIWGLLACYEFYNLITTTGAKPQTYFGLIWSLLFIISQDSQLQAFINRGFDINLITPLLLTSAVVISLICLLSYSPKEKAFISWAWMMAGILYIGWLTSYLVAIRGFDYGRNWAFFVLFVTFASDTSAYLVGSTLGRHYLAPYISPKKTWEGAIGGGIGAVLVSLIFILPTTLNLPITAWQAILAGLLVSFFGQLGDMVKSLFKRNMRAKDSGKLLPGHGGFLDRLDSVLFAAVVIYYYVIWVIR
ncbi:MAG: phosphatidate cytidylyltransferase [Chloroflexota bacterium]